MGPIPGNGDRARARCGADLVLVHGLGSAASYWDNVVGELEASFKVHAPHLPGHGPDAGPVPDSRAHPAALARTLIDQLGGQGVSHPHLVGISLGGWVVLEMAAQGYGASVTALAPAGLWQHGAIGADRFERLFRHALVPMMGLVPPVSHLAPVRALSLNPYMAHPDRVTRSQFLQAAWALAQARGYGALDRAAIHDRYVDRGRTTVPVTVTFGDRDRVLPFPRAQEVSELPPQAQVVRVASCGHAMTWDQPQACLTLIADTAARA